VAARRERRERGALPLGSHVKNRTATMMPPTPHAAM
jgi:hypothetical protein